MFGCTLSSIRILLLFNKSIALSLFILEKSASVDTSIPCSLACFRIEQIRACAYCA